MRPVYPVERVPWGSSSAAYELFFAFELFNPPKKRILCVSCQPSAATRGVYPQGHAASTSMCARVQFPTGHGPWWYTPLIPAWSCAFLSKPLFNRIRLTRAGIRVPPPETLHNRTLWMSLHGRIHGASQGEVPVSPRQRMVRSRRIHPC